MSVAVIRARVEAGVAERIIPVLFDRAKARHAKREWRTCSCDWCAMKRRQTAHCAFAPYWMPREARAVWRENEAELSRERLNDAYAKVQL